MKNIKALFINPPDVFSKVFPFGLSQIISIAKNKGAQVKLIDLNNYHSSSELTDKTINRILDFNPDILGLTGFSHNIGFIAKISSLVKHRKPGILVIGGGYWCRWSPEAALRNTSCDITFNGEGDIPFSLLIDYFPDTGRMSGIKGLSFRMGSSIIDNGQPEEIEELDSLPDPEYDMFDYGKNYVWKDGNRVVGSLQTGRGCIGRCIFCTGAKQHFRKYTPEKIIKNMKYVKDRYGVDAIYFKESLTITKDNWSKKFLNQVIDFNLGLDIGVVARVDNLDYEILNLLKKAGCYLITIGIESGDDRMLNNIMNKRITAKQISSILAMSKKLDIDTYGGLILGLPGENLRSLLKTSFFMLTNRISGISIYFPSPYPGTELFEIAKKKLNMSDEDILLDSKLHYSGYIDSCRRSIQFLKKFKFCALPPYTLIFFRQVIAECTSISRAYGEKKYPLAMLKVAIFFILRIPKEIIRFVYYGLLQQNEFYITQKLSSLPE